ncbi:general substrate transporter [Fusarium oxysporum]|uniref:Uncharacterized protein n=1 Tax=Fusarium oxysporum TaxID=5507 RepID=A0A420MCK6_FUSOX|nr:general substrate transporter [Fusarium oxysporum]RKK65767.1 hypothetical protein BFJ69_g15993 [Fusarium oxysporum]RKK78582.1 hypothetical protein BFJ71_g16441 [Fusarium oxysporum]
MPSPTPSIDPGKARIDQIEVLQTLEVTGENEKSVWQLLREHPRIILCTFLANCGALLFGYDVLVQGAITALPAFSIYYGSPFGETMILPALWQGLWQAFNSMGIMVGASCNGALQDKFGRKYMFSVSGLIAAIGAVLTFISGDMSTVGVRRGILLLGKFVIGVGMGIGMSTCQTYVAEISPAKLRTFLLGLYPFLICVGQMIAVSVVFANVTDFTKMAFKIPFASQWAFSGLAVIATLVLPESPVHLVTKQKEEQARKALQRLHGSGVDVTPLIQIIKTTIEHERTESFAVAEASYTECFKGTNLRRTRIVALLNTLQQLIGVSLVANSTYFFIMAGMNPTQSLTINQIGVGLSMVGTLISWFVMARFGRRATILCGFAIAGIIFIAMGVAGFFPNNPKALNFLGVSVLLTALTSNLSVGSAYPIVSAEIPSARLRAKALGFGFLVNAFMSWAFNLTVPYMFNADQGNLGGKIGFVFAATCVIGFALSWLEIPETRNISYAHIDYLFNKGTSTRNFKKEARSVTEIIVDNDI